MHDILMITYKRAAFTRKSLERLLETCDSRMRVWVWHNGDDAETLEVVRSFERHPRFFRLHVCPENQKLRGPTNWFWQHSEGDFVSKVDDDCLVSDGWGARLREVSAADDQLGLLACWHFYDDDFVPELARRKIRSFKGSYQVMTHGFVQGSGYVMKRAVYRQLGPIRPSESFTTYCLRASYRGWINGWLFPFVHIDHMDDARSPNYPYQTDEAFLANPSLSKVNFGIHSLADAKAFSRTIARRVQEDVTDPRAYFGWRGFLRRIGSKIVPSRRNLGNPGSIG